MKRVLVPLAPGFEEIEAVTVIDVLRRAGVEVAVAATTAGGPIEGSNGIRITTDTLLDQMDSADFDMIVLPGGSTGVENLKKDPRVVALLGQFAARGKQIAAICAAPSLLVTAGLVSDKKVTSHPCVKELVAASSIYSEDRVVVDGTWITSRGPGTAMEFALKLVEILAGVKKVSELKQGMLAL